MHYVWIHLKLIQAPLVLVFYHMMLSQLNRQQDLEGSLCSVWSHPAGRSWASKRAAAVSCCCDDGLLKYLFADRPECWLAAINWALNDVQGIFIWKP
jgi:hypothetical protein